MLVDDLPTSPFPAAGAFRVARVGAELQFAEIAPNEFLLPDAGNRYDVLGGGVLYASTQLEGCYGETLARFRPTPAMRKALEADPEWADEERAFMPVGAVAQAWRLSRTKCRIRCVDPLPFLDVTDHECIDGLNRSLGTAFNDLGLRLPIDISDVQGSNRRLTRTIATWAYDLVDDSGEPVFGGIRYASRLGPWTNWAIFEGTDVQIQDAEAIPKPESEPALARIQSRFDIRVH